jgi:putative nucleotidyltransferase with HDIG domain
MIVALFTLSFAIITFIFFVGLFFLYYKNQKNRSFLWTALTFFCSSVALLGEYLPQVNQTPLVVVWWTKITYLGEFGFLFVFPLFAASIIGKKLNRNITFPLLIVTFAIQMLTVFTTLIISNTAEPHLGVLHGGMGVLYPFAVALLIGVSAYTYFQIIVAIRKSVVREINYYPMIAGMGFCIITGVIDYLNILNNRPLVLGIKEPFIFGVFIMTLSFAETFFSQFSWVFTAFTRSEIEIEKLTEKSNKNFMEFVQLIARTLDAKDHYTAGHSLRVMDYALKIAQALGLPPAETEILKQACLLHDIGKIGIPDGILNKKSPLSDKDREHIVRHPTLGKQILSSVGDFQSILEVIQAHHERVDGKGYPNGLIRDEIPLLARILAVADTFDAICSERPYRRAKSKVQAIQELKNVKSTQLDESIVDKFLEVLE